MGNKELLIGISVIGLLYYFFGGNKGMYEGSSNINIAVDLGKKLQAEELAVSNGYIKQLDGTFQNSVGNKFTLLEIDGEYTLVSNHWL